MRWLPSKSPFGVGKRNKRRNCGVLGKDGTTWEMAATSLHDDVLLDTEECHEREADSANADVDTLVASSEGTRSGEVAAEVSC